MEQAEIQYIERSQVGTEFITVADFATLVGFTEATVRKACSRGDIAAIKARIKGERMGDTWFIDRSAANPEIVRASGVFSASHANRDRIDCPVSKGRLEEIYYASKSLADTARITAEIAGEEKPYSVSVVRRWMREYKIPARSMHGAAVHRYRSEEGKAHIRSMGEKASEKNSAPSTPRRLLSPRVQRKKKARDKSMESRLVSFACPVCGAKFDLMPGQINQRKKQSDSEPFAPTCSRRCGVRLGHRRRKENVRREEEQAMLARLGNNCVMPGTQAAEKPEKKKRRSH